MPPSARFLPACTVCFQSATHRTGTSKDSGWHTTDRIYRLKTCRYGSTACRWSVRKPQTNQHREYDNNADHLEHPVQTHGRMAFHIRHTEKDQQNDTANPKRPPNLKRSEIPRYQHAQRERKEHSQHPSPEVQSVERPAHANHAVAHHVGQGKPRKSYSKQYHQDGQRFVAQPVDEKSIKNIPDIFKKQRPAGTVQRKHLPVSAYVITRSRIGRYENIASKRASMTAEVATCVPSHFTPPWIKKVMQPITAPMTIIG